MAILLFQTVGNELEGNRARATLAREGVLTVSSVIGLRHPNRWHVFPDTAPVEYVTGTAR